VVRAYVAKEKRMARRVERRTISRFVAAANAAAEAHSRGQEVGDWEEGDGWRRCPWPDEGRWDEDKDEENDFDYGSEVDVEDEGFDPSESDGQEEEPRDPLDREDSPGNQGGAMGASGEDVLMVM
jgi:hypothetical protein